MYKQFRKMDVISYMFNERIKIILIHNNKVSKKHNDCCKQTCMYANVFFFM